MALVLTRRGSLLPSFTNDFFDGDLFPAPTLLDIDSDFINSRLLRGTPSVNIMEDENQYQIELAAPGLKKDDFKVEIDNGVLTVSAENETEEDEDDVNYTRREFSYNAFCRSFNIPENSLTDKITAEYEGGILTLSLPKKEITVSKPKKEIKVA